MRYHCLRSMDSEERIHSSHFQRLLRVCESSSLPSRYVSSLRGRAERELGNCPGELVRPGLAATQGTPRYKRSGPFDTEKSVWRGVEEAEGILSEIKALGRGRRHYILSIRVGWWSWPSFQEISATTAGWLSLLPTRQSTITHTRTE